MASYNFSLKPHHGQCSPPHDQAPNEQILLQIICVNLLLPLKLCNNVFTCEVVQLCEAVVCSVIAINPMI